jgi:hypothetical protein
MKRIRTTTYLSNTTPNAIDVAELANPPKTGWPAPALMQDDDRKLFRWFAGRVGSRRLVRESVAAIQQGERT